MKSTDLSVEQFPIYKRAFPQIQKISIGKVYNIMCIMRILFLPWIMNLRGQILSKTKIFLGFVNYSS